MEQKKSSEKKKTAAKKPAKKAVKKKKLLIVESPAKAKTIEKYLGSGYRVVASNGHVRDLPKSTLGIDVDNGFEPKYITIRGRGDIIAGLKKEAKAASAVYLATDPDREGEAISWHLASILGIDEDAVCRVEFNEITKDAVKNAIVNPRSINLSLVDAQQARRLLDRLVGYQISPILWSKVRRGLSAGRVQSAATRLICDREAEIRDFVPQEYWTLSAKAKTAQGKKIDLQYNGESGKGTKQEFATEDEVNEVINRINGHDMTVMSVEETSRTLRPTPPFTTSTLQQEASRKLGFTTRRTMMIAQQLYEGVEVKGHGLVGLVSYIRTDSVRISDLARAAAKEYIITNYGESFYPERPNVYKGRSSAQDAHEAIRPTYIDITPQAARASLDDAQYKLYNLIYSRFIASQMSSAVYSQKGMTAETEGYRFRASGSKLTFPGFKVVYGEEKEDQDTMLPDELKKGDILKITKIASKQHFTEAPSRYTESALVRTMEDLGIGRPSTYAPIISNIIDRGYVKRVRRTFYATELGETVTDLMRENFSDIVDLKFTADMEKKLDGVEAGEIEWKNVIGEFYGPFEKNLEVAESKIEKIEIKDEVTDIPCELCGEMMVIKNGRNGKFLACPKYPECKFTKSILDYIEVPCPKCGGKVAIRHTRRGRLFYGCEMYPTCDFVSWEKPAEEKCPKCGGYMTERRGRSGFRTVVCAEKSCGEKLEIPIKKKEEN